jgi:hypothetical protein
MASVFPVTVQKHKCTESKKEVYLETAKCVFISQYQNAECNRFSGSVLNFKQQKHEDSICGEMRGRLYAESLFLQLLSQQTEL